MLAMLVITAGPVLAKDYDLHQAVMDNNKQLVDKLIRKGLYIDEIGSRKYGYGSPLHLAVRVGHLDIAKLLLKRGAQVDVLDPDDLTPLHNAAWNGNLEMTQLLLEAGADIEASTYDGDTPLKLAQNNDQAQVAEFIQAKLQTPPVNIAKAASTPTNESGVIDITGTYISEVTGPSRKKLRLKGANPEVKLVQAGSQVTGTFEPGGKLWGNVNGNSVELDYTALGGWYGKVNWMIKPGSNELVGTWAHNKTIGKDGNWTLTRVE